MNHDDPTTALKTPDDPATEAAAPPDPPPIRYAPSGRRLYTLEELPPKLRLRVEHAGKWVAWSSDGETIVASAERLREMDDLVQQSGIQGAVYECLEPELDPNLGR